MIHNITKKQYVENPCKVCSVAFWKNESYQIPSGIRVIHKSEFVSTTNDKDAIDRYFKLIHNLDNMVVCPLPAGYYFRNVDTENQKEIVENIINRCYDDIGVTIAQIERWTKNEVFDSDLWLFIYGKEGDMPVALGIADFDSDIKECSLEWIQVLPEKRGQGLGGAIICELLSRAKNKANFATVSGKIDNLTNPEVLYRKCGFSGNDIWCVVNYAEEDSK